MMNDEWKIKYDKSTIELQDYELRYIYRLILNVIIRARIYMHL